MSGTIQANNQILRGRGLVIVGNRNIVSGSECTITGDHNTVSGSNCTVMGNANEVSGSNSIVTGHQNCISGSNCTVWGNNNTVCGSTSRAFGDNNIVSGYNASAEGENNQVTTGTITINGTQTIVNGNVYSNVVLDGNEARIAIANAMAAFGDVTFIDHVHGDYFVAPPGSLTARCNNDDVYVKGPTVGDLKHDKKASNGKSCIICLDNAPICIALPCLHLVYCIDCARSLCFDGPDRNIKKRRGQVKCAKCRQEVTAISRAFLDNDENSLEDATAVNNNVEEESPVVACKKS